MSILDPLQYLSSLCGRTNQTLTEDEALDWERKIFSKFSPDIVVNALSTHADRSQFRPQISDILKLLGASNVNNSHGALNDLVGLVRRYGPYRTPCVKDPVVMHVIQELGGWPAVCQALPDPVTQDIAFDRFAKRFAALYEQSDNRVRVLGLSVSMPPIGLIAAQTNASTKALQIDRSNP